MCEPTTIAAIATYFGSTAAASTAGVAALTTAQSITLAAGVASAGLGAASAYQQSSTAKAVAQNNASNASVLAADAITRGDKQAAQVRQRGSQLEGAQRATLSARGLDISEGTPANILAQTDFFTQSDEATTRTNASREASADIAQSRNFQGQAGAINPGLQLAGSLLGSGSSVAGKWADYSRLPAKG